MMAGIKGKDTKIEVALRSALHRRGFRFRKNVRALAGSPDIVFPKLRTVLFVHGCFWHMHDCSLFKWPGTRRDFWREKIMGNHDRDLRNEELLAKDQWRIVKIWECAVRGPTRRTIDEVADELAAFLISDRKACEIRGK